jgi:Tol biopolymer transport system component
LPLATSTKIGPYEVTGTLGAGGMGEVYRARDQRLGRDVAIKVLPHSFVADVSRLRRFEQEARAAAALNHPNILAVFDIGTYSSSSSDGATAPGQESPYIVSELLEGQTLRARLSGGALPVRKAIDYAQQIARGLAAAHDKGIVHRDLKPENIFVTNDGRIKILDFGLAKLTRPETSEGHSVERTLDTDAGAVLGTVGYMSPEQVRGQPADARSDLFSVGAILYEMLSGKRAFKGDSPAETMSAILKEEPPELTETNRAVPAALERIVRHCLEKNPVERFQSARDIAFDLESLSSDSVAAGAVTSASRRKNYRELLGMLGFLGLAAFVGTFVAGRSSVPTQVPPRYHQLTFQHGLVTSGFFGPDGHTIVYAADWESAPRQLFSTRDEARGSLALGLKNADVAAISSSGDVAVLMDQHRIVGWAFVGTLAVTSINGGAPRPLLENASAMTWTPDGSGFAVVRYTGQHFRLEYPSGKELFVTSGWISSPRFSPKGDRIAFIHHPEMGDDRGEIVIVDLAGHSRVVAGGFASAQGLAWMPSKDEIWFTASDTGTVTALRAVTTSSVSRVVARAPGRLRLFDIAKDGRVLLSQESARRGVVIHTASQKTERDLALLDWSLLRDISKDGQNVLITEEGEGGGPNYSVYLRNISDMSAIRLGDGDAWAISPDGKWVLAASMTSPRKVYLLPTGAGDRQELNVGQVHFESGTFTPDGEKLVFSGVDPSGSRRVYTMDVKGGAALPVTPPGLHVLNADSIVSPDGKTILASDGLKWWRYSIDGGEGRAALGLKPDDVIAGWSRNGESVLAGPQVGAPVRIDRVDLATGNREFCCAFSPADTTGVFVMGPLILTENKDLYGYGYGRINSALYLMDAPK